MRVVRGGAVAIARRSLAWLIAGPLAKFFGTFGLLGAMRGRLAAQRALLEGAKRSTGASPVNQEKTPEA